MKYALSTLAFVTSVAMAHPGHDHSHWSAVYLHALWLAPVAVTALVATYFVFKKIKK